LPIVHKKWATAHAAQCDKIVAAQCIIGSAANALTNAVYNTPALYLQTAHRRSNFFTRQMLFLTSNQQSHNKALKVSHNSCGQTGDVPSVCGWRAGKHNQVEVDVVVEVGVHHGAVQRGGVTLMSAVKTDDGRRHRAPGQLGHYSLSSLSVRLRRRLSRVVQHVLSIPLTLSAHIGEEN